MKIKLAALCYAACLLLSGCGLLPVLLRSTPPLDETPISAPSPTPEKTTLPTASPTATPEITPEVDEEAIGMMMTSPFIGTTIFISDPEWVYYRDEDINVGYIFHKDDTTYQNMISITSYPIFPNDPDPLGDMWTQKQKIDSVYNVTKAVEKSIEVSSRLGVTQGYQTYEGRQYSYILEGVNIEYVVFIMGERAYSVIATYTDAEAGKVLEILQGLLDFVSPVEVPADSALSAAFHGQGGLQI